MDNKAPKTLQTKGSTVTLTKQLILEIVKLADRNQKAEQAFVEARYVGEAGCEIASKEAAYRSAFAELVFELEGLGESSLMDLQAIVYLGREDYSRFAQARQEIREEIPWAGLEQEARHCAGKLLLGEYLRAGMKKMKLDDWTALSE